MHTDPPTPSAPPSAPPSTPPSHPSSGARSSAAPAADHARSVYMETFGCQMNVLDTQLVHGQLEGLGYRFTDDWRSADVILYNTCSVRQRAEQKVWSRVGQVGVHKRDHPWVVLGVIGCMAERDGRDMVRRHPQIDLLCGPGELDKVPMLIDNAVRTAPISRGGPDNAGLALQGNTHRRSRTLAAAEDRLELLDLARSFSPRDVTAAGRSAYVRITRGCNKFCTYCVVPYTRGREVHRPPDHILEECRKLVAAGAVEITLLGQTVNHYHYDRRAAMTIGGVQQPQVGATVKNNGNQARRPPSARLDRGTTTFADLLARIHDELPELQRLRFVTSFPRDFGDDVLQVMAERPRICRYLHLPVQSGSDAMLRRMNRGYTVAEYENLIGRVRRRLPAAEIATDIICGFPGETEDDHQATADLLRRCGFKNAFIFKYSPRPGTAARDRFTDDVPEAVKKRRNNELLAVQAQVSAQRHARYVGRTVRVFVESISARARKDGGRGGGGGGQDPSTRVELGWEKPEPLTQLTGRTEGDLIVCFQARRPSDLIGRIVEVEIQRAAPLTLFGRLPPRPDPGTCYALPPFVATS